MLSLKEFPNTGMYSTAEKKTFFSSISNFPFLTKNLFLNTLYMYNVLCTDNDKNKITKIQRLECSKQNKKKMWKILLWELLLIFHYQKMLNEEIAGDVKWKANIIPIHVSYLLFFRFCCCCFYSSSSCSFNLFRSSSLPFSSS